MNTEKYFSTNNLYEILELESTAQIQDGNLIIFQMCST